MIKVINVTFKKPHQTLNYADAVLQELTSTGDIEFAAEILDRGRLDMPNTHTSGQKLNMMLQALANHNPKDAVEAKLCMQETVLYAQGMNFLTKAENALHIEQKDFYVKNAIKLLRLHNETIESLIKYKRGGEQRVIVQHVTVHEGAQAVVGTINTGGGVNQKNDEVIP